MSPGVQRTGTRASAMENQEVCHGSPVCQNYSPFRRRLETVGTRFGGMQASSVFAGNRCER